MKSADFHNHRIVGLLPYNKFVRHYHAYSSSSFSSDGVMMQQLRMMKRKGKGQAADIRECFFSVLSSLWDEVVYREDKEGRKDKERASMVRALYRVYICIYGAIAME